MAGDGVIRIRVKTGESEAEIEAPPASIREAMELIPEMVARLPEPKGRGELREERTSQAPEMARTQAVPMAPSSLPAVTIEKGDSLSDVISRFFSDQWGRTPKKLNEVRDALQSYGLNYPKQSVAVALLRLAKGSKIRRFKGETGEYVYTASTGAARILGPSQPAIVPTAEESAPLQGGEEQEEQLDLDAPAAN